MAINKRDKKRAERRALRVRSKIKLFSGLPRVSVFRSLKHIYAQLIDDAAGITLAAASTLSDELSNVVGPKKEQARHVGLVLAKKAKEKGVEKVVFDRGQYKYHGRLKALADGLRDGGIAL